MDDLVSIITPAYNSDKFIAETVRSVQSQTHKNWEMLITDDASVDHLEQTVLTLSQQDPRIKYYKLEKNSGPAVARNQSIQSAKGRYLAFLDSDDLWHPSKLERQLQFMSDNKVDFSFTYYRRMSEAGEPFPFSNTSPAVVNYKMLLKDTTIGTLTVMLDRKSVGEVRLKPNWGYDDFVLWLDLLRGGRKAYCLPETLAFYRVMNRSVSSNKLRASKWVWKIYRKHERLSLFESLWCFVNFTFNAALKRLRYVPKAKTG